MRLKNNSMMSIEDISYNVICAVDSVKESLSLCLPKSIYQLTLFNLLARQGFKLHTQEDDFYDSLNKYHKKEIIVVNETLVIECVVQESDITDSQRRMMFDYDNDFVTGIIINFGNVEDNKTITRVYQNSVLH